MGHSIGDGLITVALAGALVAYLYFKHIERKRRLEIIHQERVAAMDKGIPLPELPLDPTKDSRPADPRAPLIHGLVWTSLGLGAMIALALGPFPNASAIWPLPLPLVTLGGGLILYYVLASGRER
jgi:hypothetical protein